MGGSVEKSVPEVLSVAGLTWGLRGAGLQVTGLFAHRLHQRVAAPDDVLPLVALHIPHPHADAAGFRALGKREGEVRQVPAIAGVCTKPGSAQKSCARWRCQGREVNSFPWLNVTSQPHTAGLLLHLCCQHHQPPAAASARGYVDALPFPAAAILPPPPTALRKGP